MTNIAVVGLGFGDEGKGTTVDWLCRTRRVECVFRHNGGAQAYHNVVRPDGEAHGFAQWGSGTFAGVPTVLSRHMLIDPEAMKNEAEHLESLGVDDPWGLQVVSYDAKLITPLHIELVRWREDERGDNRHGSTGYGIGEVMRYALEHGHPLRAEDVFSDNFEFKMHELSMWCQEQMGRERYGQVIHDDWKSYVANLQSTYREVLQGRMIERESEIGLLRAGNVVFEGAQGVLLDEWYGFHPHTTWSTTTFENADALLKEAGVQESPVKLGVIRSYFTRHGYGPFPTFNRELTRLLHEPYNKGGKWYGGFRAGHFDLPLFRYAIDVCGQVDGLVMTHIDRAANVRVVDHYDDGSRTIGKIRGHHPHPEDLPAGDEWLRSQSFTTHWLKKRRGILSERSSWYTMFEVAESGDLSDLGVKIPIVLTSNGPTFEDKTEVRPITSSDPVPV